MTEEEIIDEVSKYPCSLVVITGGEPSLFITDSLVDLLKSKGFYVAVETNGTHLLPKNIDYVTCSPKTEFANNAEVVINHIDEIKVVYNGENNMELYDKYSWVRKKYLQPCDTGVENINKEIVRKCVDFILKNPDWTLSLQTQKIIDVR